MPPASLIEALRAEGIVVLEEGVPGHVLVRNVRRPGRRIGVGWYGGRYALALTEQRLLVLRRRRASVDVAWDAPKITELDFRVDDGALKIAYDIADFQPRWRGFQELTLRCSEPERVLEQILSRSAATVARVGALAQPLRAAVEAEGVVALEEGIRGRVVMRKLRRPGRYNRYLRKGTAFALVLSRERLLVVSGNTRHIDLPWAAPQIGALRSSSDGTELTLAVDVGVFHAGHKGTREIVLRCARPDAVLGEIRARSRAGDASD